MESVKTKKAVRKKGMNPWVPNQHGAWAMLITPAVVGTVVALGRWVEQPEPAGIVVILAILVAWFFGYFSFFAFGLVAKARGPRKKEYARPLAVYGPLSLVGIAVALALQPQLGWWALFFAPLVAVAVWEALQRRPRSLASGVSTTIASALLLPALDMAGSGVATPVDLPATTWMATLFLGVYFTGTIPFVKTMIRNRGSRPYFYGSVAFHVLALLVVPLVGAAGASTLAVVLAMLTLLVALARAIAFPMLAARGRSFTPKFIGMSEAPVCTLAAVAALAIAL